MLKFSIKWGLILSLVAIIWHLFERIFGLHGEYIHLHPLLTNLFIVPAIVVYAMALRERRKILGGSITYGNAFLAGFFISLATAFMSPATTLFIHKVVSPNYLPNALEYAVVNKKMTAEMAEMFFNLSNYLLKSGIGALVLGTVISAIVAFYIKRNESSQVN